MTIGKFMLGFSIDDRRSGRARTRSVMLPQSVRARGWVRARHWARPWLLLWISSALMPALCGADERAAKVNFVISGTVAAVEDGDTLTLRGAGGGRFHIRLSDLDAPETAHARNPYSGRRSCGHAPAAAPGQAGGEAARAALAQRAPLKALARAECYTVDHYGRAVCHVFVGTTNLNAEQLRGGWAMLASTHAWVRDPASRAAEQAAIQARRGIWAGARPPAPARWRRRCWCQGQCSPTAP